jgi:hypothetical protein
MLNAAKRARMLAHTQTIHDDWKRAVTIRKLATSQSAQVDELGYIASAVPVYQFSYSVNAIFHPPGVVNTRDQGRSDATYGPSGKALRNEPYARVFTTELGANPAPDTDCELIFGTTVYRILAVDLAANQYLLHLSSEL